LGLQTIAQAKNPIPPPGPWTIFDGGQCIHNVCRQELIGLAFFKFFPNVLKKVNCRRLAVYIPIQGGNGTSWPERLMATNSVGDGDQFTL
tara:strand:- start:51 stop:320 length:270 start_codon:yes stop_codon:yes gene_type:complete